MLLSSRNDSLNDILSREKLKNDKKGIGFSKNSSSTKGKSTGFIQTAQDTDQDHIPKNV